MSGSYRQLNKQVTFSALYKVLVIVLNFILTSLLLRYLGLEDFGFYIALTSLMSWMFLFDLGMAKGMRNNVSLCVNNNDFSNASEYISSTYFGVTVVSVLSLTFTLLFINNFEMGRLINSNKSEEVLKVTLIALAVGFFVRFPLSTVDQLNFAIHKSERVIFNNFLTAIFNCLSIAFLMFYSGVASVKNAIVIFAISISLPYIISTYFFFKKIPRLKPSIFGISKLRLYETMNKGSQILFIQIGFLFFVGLDRLLLLKFGTAEYVTNYEITYKVMSILIFPVSILTAPLWSSFTNAYAKKDIAWIKWVFNKFYKIIFLMLLVSFLLIISFDKAVYFWLGMSLNISLTLKAAVAFLVLSIIWGGVHSDLLLGTSHFKFVLYLSLAGCLLKIVVLCYYLNFKSNSLTPEFLVFSSILAYSLFNLCSPFYARYILKNEP